LKANVSFNRILCRLCVPAERSYFVAACVQQSEARSYRSFGRFIDDVDAN